MRILIVLFCLLIVNSLRSEYYSQRGQDRYVNEIVFQNKRNGIFVDIGAHDGIRFSNTCFFEKELGWYGICVEPIPEIFERLEKNRSSICVQGCISNVSEQNLFLKIQNNKLGEGGPEMLSGLIDKYDTQHLERIKNEVVIDESKTEVIMVDCYLLNDLLRQSRVNHIDYLSIDTEGGELDILKSIDFEQFDIDVIDVENNYDDSEYKNFLRSKGFILIQKMGPDEIYRNSKYQKE